MPELASSENEIILYYNPNSPLSKKSLGYAKGEGLRLKDVDVLKNKFTGTQLEELAERLKVPLDGLINKEHPDFDSGFEHSEFSDNDWIKVIQNSPQFLKVPIAIHGHHAIFVKSPSDLCRL